MAPLARNACAASLYCEAMDEIAERLRLPPSLPWRCAHIGPIDTPRTLLVEHRSGLSPRVRQVPVSVEWGAYHGLYLDVLGVSSPPPGIEASYQGLTGLWYVYSVARRADDDPRVSFWVDSSGVAHTEVLRPPNQAPNERLVHRLIGLLQGRFGRRAPRPARTENARTSIEAILAQAEAVKTASPDLPWVVIAGRLGVSDRSLRRYRNDPALRAASSSEPRRQLA